MPENPHSVELVENEGTTDLSEYGLEDDSEVVPPPQLPSFNCNELKIVDSNEIHVGHRTYYTGSVTIKQIVVPETGNGDVRIENIQASNAKSNTQLVPQLQQEDAKKPSKLIPLKKSPYLMGGLFIVLLVLICLIIYLTVPSSSTSDEDNYPMNSSVRLILKRRADWRGLPARETTPLKEYPAPYVIISHTATSNCTTTSVCSVRLQNIQTFHFGLGWTDIASNFYIGGDGFIYEGRGWHSTGAHSVGFNSISIGISFIGNFMLYPAPKRQINAALMLLEEASKSGKLAPNYKLLYHQQIKSTDSPGTYLIEEIKTWPHWTDCGNTCTDFKKLL